jgi:hypothetical protein
MSRFTCRALSLTAAAVLAAVVAGCTDAAGYYRPAAEAECRTRGVDPQGPTFAACVKAIEDAEYRRWARSVPGH